MKINELLASMHRKDFNIEKELQVKKYLPIEVKQTIANEIIDDCTSEENGVIVIDSIRQYLSYVKYMVLYHTNLDYEDRDYDILCSTDFKDADGNTMSVLDTIMNSFGNDAKECSRIMGMAIDDYMQQNSMEFVVAKFLTGLRETIDEFADKLGNKVEKMNIADMIPNDLDMNTLSKFLNTYIK